MAERRHARDTTSLVLGLLLLAPAVLFLLADTIDRTVDGRWIAPVLLVGIGVLGLLSARTSGRRRSSTTPSGSTSTTE